MHIGLDLDNTIIDYNVAFVSVGRVMNLLPPSRAFDGKATVKGYLVSGPGGENAWMRLQGQVYGGYIREAKLADGVKPFIANQRLAGHRVSIVSHKTQYGHHDSSGTDLRAAALGFLRNKGIIAIGDATVDPSDVFFEDTRARKLARIGDLGCTVFVDDLPEVLNHAEFPRGVRRIWYAASQAAVDSPKLMPYRSWRDIAATITP